MKSKALKALPLAVLIMLLASPFIIDFILVSAGAAHAAILCQNPGPLQVFNKQKWQKYSLIVRASIPSDWKERPDNVVPRIRERLGISLRGELVQQKNILYWTASYNRDIISHNGKDIAALNYYRSDNIGPFMRILADGHSNNFTCSPLHPEIFPNPEFSLL